MKYILIKPDFLYLLDRQINDRNITRYMIQVTSLYLFPCVRIEVALWQETQDPILTKAERLHEIPIGVNYDPPQQEADTEEETSRPSSSILLIRCFMTLRKEVGRKVVVCLVIWGLTVTHRKQVSRKLVISFSQSHLYHKDPNDLQLT